MKTIRGRVSSGSQGLRSILIEAFDTNDKFQECLPINKRDELNRDFIKRLGSTVTDANGEFEIQYTNAIPKKRWIKNENRVNLWLIASACKIDCQDIEIVFQAEIVRINAGDSEYYAICLSDDYVDKNNNANRPIDNTPESIASTYDNQVKIDTANLNVSKDKFDRRLEIRKEYEVQIAPKIREELSFVEVDDSGEPLDPDYVKSNESVRAKAEKRMLSVMVKDFDVEAKEKMALSGRISLTPEQKQKIEAANEVTVEGDNIIVDEDVLFKVLEDDDSTGSNPESGSQIVNRVDAVKLFCRSKTKAELCLADLENPENPPEEDENGDEGDVEPRVESNPERRNEDIVGTNVTAQQLKDSIPQYIAKILDEISVLDSGGSELPAPGSQLTEDGIAQAGSFPSLSLPPGPADIPAFYDFYDLQIAFKPVWTEALDESLIDDIGAYYDHFVENGGNTAAFLDGINDPNCKILKIGHFNFISFPEEIVQTHFDITNEEWNALNAKQRTTLKDISIKTQKYFDKLEERFDDDMFDSGDNSKDLPSYNRTRQYVLDQVHDLQEQGNRFIHIARAELERQAMSKSIVPNNKILNQLIDRANSAYPAKYFAANKRQRSVNFGVLVNYRQRWTPTAYQVGELVKSIPLAPKETRKYSKKIVKKTKRARKEIESNLDALKSETNSTTRSEADIVQKAMEKTNFNASAQGSFTIGVWSGGGSSGLSQDAESQSSENKKSFHEAVVKAAREYKNEHKVELETESVFESEFQESGEIMNPNDELTVTYLFYELQRRYRVEERLHRLTSVVLVAQEMPCPGDIDEDWLIAHRWILNRVMLDDSFKQPLFYVAEGQVAEQFALEELRKTLAQQRRLVEDLREDVSESRELTESRYAALQRSMERTARATQRKKKGGGLLGFATKLTTAGIVGDFVDKFIGGDNETPEAARVREAAAQDAYQRELQKLRDNEAQLAQSNNSLEKATEEYSNRLSEHLSNVVLVTELKNHVKDNITHYMQAIWMHEPFQQRWLRLKDVPVPVLKGAKKKYKINSQPILGSLANVAHLRTKVHDYTTTADILLPPEKENGDLETVPLYQVADIDGILGFRANYMIFPMKKANAITEFMMEPYVEKAGGAYGLTDPDELGNLSLDDFSEYVCCLKKKLDPKEFAELKEELLAQLKKLLQSPLRDDEEIVVPMDAMYIEALPGATPILENFKLLHRQIDAADAQEDLRLKKMEKLRYAQRLLVDEHDDPETDAKYVFEGAPGVSVGTQPSGGGN